MKYFLIGEKLSHSFSPQIHSFFGNDNYSLLEISQDNLEDFMKKRDFDGINVTIPYKKAVMPFCDFISDEAKKISCVNTIVNKNGVLYGYNTDYFGFSYMCKTAGISFENKKVIIFGSGGTSLTATAVANDFGAREVIIVSRHGENNYENILNHADCDIIINTTPVGMYPNVDNSPVKIDGFKNLSGVIDVIYNPLKTKFLIDAKNAKIPHTGGITMLVAQAFSANNLFFDIDEDEAEIQNAKKYIEHFVRNIILVGMPGCGKTTVGKMLAKSLDIAFVDTDYEVELIENMPPEKIIESSGEEYFRQVESDVIKSVCQKKMQVIATGGGSILSEKNRSQLQLNGIVIWLDRNIDNLDTKNRPLSQGKNNLMALYEKRAPIYKQMCDIRIDAQKSLLEIVQEIQNELK